MTQQQKVHGSTTVMDKKFHGQTGIQANQMVEVARAVYTHLDLPAPLSIINGLISLVQARSTSFVNSR